MGAQPSAAAPKPRPAAARAEASAPPPASNENDPFASQFPPATDVDKDHDTVIGMLVDKFQRERGKRSDF
jgi:hypothetical protein